MGHWETWEIALWGAAAYLAVALLVRLMLHRRNELLDEVRQQLEVDRKRRAAQARAKAKAEAAARARGRNAA